MLYAIVLSCLGSWSYAGFADEPRPEPPRPRVARPEPKLISAVYPPLEALPPKVEPEPRPVLEPQPEPQPEPIHYRTDRFGQSWFDRDLDNLERWIAFRDAVPARQYSQAHTLMRGRCSSGACPR